MHEDIKILFKMAITQDNKEQVVDFTANGRRYHKNDKTYILFKEPVIEANQSNDVTFILDQEEMTIIRKGFVEMNQKYKLGQETIGKYKNEYIQTEMLVYTKAYNYSEKHIQLKYDIKINDEVVGNYDLEINIKGVGLGE